MKRTWHNGELIVSNRIMSSKVPTCGFYNNLVKKRFYDGLTTIFGADIPGIAGQQFLSIMTFVSVSLIVKSYSTVQTSASLSCLLSLH